jgi:hypothetical protein
MGGRFQKLTEVTEVSAPNPVQMGIEMGKIESSFIDIAFIWDGKSVGVNAMHRSRVATALWVGINFPPSPSEPASFMHRGRMGPYAPTFAWGE